MSLSPFGWKIENATVYDTTNLIIISNKQNSTTFSQKLSRSIDEFSNWDHVNSFNSIIRMPI